jgi:hypothetical protein
VDGGDGVEEGLGDGVGEALAGRGVGAGGRDRVEAHGADGEGVDALAGGGRAGGLAALDGGEDGGETVAQAGLVEQVDELVVVGRGESAFLDGGHEHGVGGGAADLLGAVGGGDALADAVGFSVLAAFAGGDLAVHVGQDRGEGVEVDALLLALGGLGDEVCPDGFGALVVAGAGGLAQGAAGADLEDVGQFHRRSPPGAVGVGAGRLAHRTGGGAGSGSRRRLALFLCRILFTSI